MILKLKLEAWLPLSFRVICFLQNIILESQSLCFKSFAQHITHVILKRLNEVKLHKFPAKKAEFNLEIKWTKTAWFSPNKAKMNKIHLLNCRRSSMMQKSQKTCDFCIIELCFAAKKVFLFACAWLQRNTINFSSIELKWIKVICLTTEEAK